MKSQLLPIQFLPNKLREKYLQSRKKQFLSQRKQKGWSQIVEFRGCKFFAGHENKIEYALLNLDGNYDWNNFTAIENMVREGDVCFDIGANIGIYSVILSKLTGHPENIHAFEPVNHIRNKLTSNCKLNGFADVHVNDFALGAEVSTAQMYQIKEDMFRGGTSTFVHNDNVKKIGTDKFNLCEVRIARLDDYVRDNHIERVNFMKIDVEGFEWPVLQGGQETIEKFGPTILLEYDPVRHQESGETNHFKEFFLDNKYQAYEFTAFGSQLVLLPFQFDHTPLKRNIMCINPELKVESRISPSAPARVSV